MSTSFAKATVSEQANGEFVADVSCLNGEPQESQYSLPCETTFFDGTTINTGDEILFTIKSDGTPDIGFIFPYNENTGSPLTIGGGIGKGVLIEDLGSTTGATGSDPGLGAPNDAAISVLWVNGMVADGVINEVSDESALSLNIGTLVYFLMTYNASDVEEVMTVTASLSSCGDVPEGASQFTFGENIIRLAQGG